MGEAVPGPAHLLAGALAACLLKNVERFHHMLPFAYTAASAEVELERRDAPPAIVRVRYRLQVHSDEPSSRCAFPQERAPVRHDHEHAGGRLRARGLAPSSAKRWQRRGDLRVIHSPSCPIKSYFGGDR